MRRLVWGLLLGAGIAAGGLFGADAAHADVSDKIAQHRAEVKAKIACHRAEMQGKPCTSTAAATAAPAPKPVAQAAPAPAPERTRPLAGSGKLIEVSISEQKLRAWEGDEVVLETPVSTGKPGHETPKGQFSILSKETNHWSTQYHVNMPWAMRVVNGIFIHELPLTTDGRRLGTSDLGRPVSAGCIRVGVGPAKQLYDWAEVGTPVLIH